MIIRLMDIKIRNFKGVKSFDLETNGKDVSIYGANEAGKSTIFDAFTWLLFGKDSLDQATFEIKTLDEAGNPITGLEHTVEAILSAENNEWNLKRVYYEKWTKKRGSAEKEFTGHTTDFFIDGVPVKEKEFKDTINSICHEGVFKLLTNLRHFNEHMGWQDRRKVLLEACGNISDADVIASNEKLQPLAAPLLKRKIDDHRKVIKSRLTEINKELEKIPVRIDEAQKSASQAPRDRKSVDAAITMVQSCIREKKDKLNAIMTGGEIVSLEKQLASIDTRIQKAELAHRKKIEEKRQAKWGALEEQRRKLSTELSTISAQIEDAIKDQASTAKIISEAPEKIAELESKIKSLRSQWYDTDKMKFEFTGETVCPTCGQDLPEDKVEEASRKAEESFNSTKADLLKSIQEQGRNEASALDQIKKSLVQHNEDLEKINQLVVDLKTKKAKVSSDLDEVSEKMKGADEPQSTRPADIVKMDTERQSIIDQIAALQSGSETNTAPIKEAIAKHEADLEALRQELTAIESNQRVEDRIESLKVQERQLAGEFETLQHELFLTDEFIRAKVSMLEEKINSKFTVAKFKLFNVQINGGVDECCETTYNGVPYGSMNNAARINCGVDIQSVLAHHYDIAMPIFIDNAESVTDILSTPAQQIRLVVSKKDKNLRIELEGEDERDSKTA